jgi:hypothetical protein
MRTGTAGARSRARADLIGDRVTIPSPVRASDAVAGGWIDQQGCCASIHAERLDPGDIVPPRLQIGVTASSPIEVIALSYLDARAVRRFRRPSMKTSTNRNTLFCQPGWSCM